MTIFADPILLSLVLAVFAALSATGTSLVIGYHFEKLRRQTVELRQAINVTPYSHAKESDHQQASAHDDLMADTRLSTIIATQEAGAAASLLNGHDPAKHVRFV